MGDGGQRALFSTFEDAVQPTANQAAVAFHGGTGAEDPPTDQDHPHVLENKMKDGHAPGWPPVRGAGLPSELEIYIMACMVCIHADANGKDIAVWAETVLEHAHTFPHPSAWNTCPWKKPSAWHVKASPLKELRAALNRFDRPSMQRVAETCRWPGVLNADRVRSYLARSKRGDYTSLTRGQARSTWSIVLIAQKVKADGGALSRDLRSQRVDRQMTTPPAELRRKRDQTYKDKRAVVRTRGSFKAARTMRENKEQRREVATAALLAEATARARDEASAATDSEIAQLRERVARLRQQTGAAQNSARQDEASQRATKATAMQQVEEPNAARREAAAMLLEFALGAGAMLLEV